jgi:hypothetical protein
LNTASPRAPSQLPLLTNFACFMSELQRRCSNQSRATNCESCPEFDHHIFVNGCEGKLWRAVDLQACSERLTIGSFIGAINHRSTGELNHQVHVMAGAMAAVMALESCLDEKLRAARKAHKRRTAELTATTVGQPTARQMCSRNCCRTLIEQSVESCVE